MNQRQISVGHAKANRCAMVDRARRFGFNAVGAFPANNKCFTEKAVASRPLMNIFRKLNED
jgi:hypothetical protein